MDAYSFIHSDPCFRKQQDCVLPFNVSFSTVQTYRKCCNCAITTNINFRAKLVRKLVRPSKRLHSLSSRQSPYVFSKTCIRRVASEEVYEIG
uniref:Ovule protein n=1 Tax=Ascaris lumbricoides TaxID=6252 RepID=A0A0M3HTH9_ASCLU